MPSLRRFEGYVCVDHSQAEGVSEQMVAAYKATHPGKDVITARTGEKKELPTYKCPYCDTTILVNPMRTRDREYCRKLDRYICDACALLRRLGHELVPMYRKFEIASKRALRGILIP